MSAESHGPEIITKAPVYEKITSAEKKEAGILWNGIIKEAGENGWGIDKIRELAGSKLSEKKAELGLTDLTISKYERSLNGRIQALERKMVMDEMEATNSPWIEVLTKLSQKNNLNIKSGFVRNYLASEIMSLRKEIGGTLDEYVNNHKHVADSDSLLINACENRLAETVSEYLDSGEYRRSEQGDISTIAHYALERHFRQGKNKYESNLLIGLIEESLIREKHKPSTATILKTKSVLADAATDQKKRSPFLDNPKGRFLKRVIQAAGAASLMNLIGSGMDEISEPVGGKSVVKALTAEKNRQVGLVREKNIRQQAEAVGRSQFAPESPAELRSTEIPPDNRVEVIPEETAVPEPDIVPETEEIERKFGFKIGGIDFTKPFNIIVPGSISRSAGFPDGAEIEINLPLVNLSKVEWPDEITGPFNKYWENKGAALIAQTDIPAHIAAIMHSFRYHGDPLPGELFRAVPDRKTLKSQILMLQQKVGDFLRQAEFKIIDVTEVGAEEYNNSDAKAVNTDDPDRFVFFRTDRWYPEEKQADKKPEESKYYICRQPDQITFVTCDGASTDENGFTSFANRLLVTAEYVIPEVEDAM